MVDLPGEGSLPSLAGATGWLNSSPLSAEGLRGRVVLVQFWTYTCINWLRTLPYVRAWAATYQDHGLVVIGVHTPEFDVEHDPDNVRRAAKDLRVDYPIAIDSNYAIWGAFGNRYWPALYFADGHGQIRHHRFGEGDYEQSEMILQRLLAEAGSGGIGYNLVSVDAPWGGSRRRLGQPVVPRKLPLPRPAQPLTIRHRREPRWRTCRSSTASDRRGAFRRLRRRAGAVPAGPCHSEEQPG
jgi:thiol-disulfide isomerase/thioredoxin